MYLSSRPRSDCLQSYRLECLLGVTVWADAGVGEAARPNWRPTEPESRRVNLRGRRGLRGAQFAIIGLGWGVGTA